ncbi:MAG: TolC family protein [Tannerella sp.]|nr:TolC family protein [Tannerella sp.]
MINAGKTATVGLLLIVGATSCRVTGSYHSPAIDTDGLYRAAAAGGGDTATIAGLPLASFFTDPVLQQLIAEGLEANFDLREAQLQIREAEAGWQTARMAGLPVVGLAGQVTHTRTGGGQEEAGPLGRVDNQYRLGATVQWEVDLWGRLARLTRAQYAQYLNSHEYRRLIQTSLVSNIAASYYTLRALDEQLRISRETAGLLEESAASMQAMMDAGLLNAAAVEQSRALLYATQVSALNLEVSIRKLENSLSVTIGRRPGAIERPAPDSSLRTPWDTAPLPPHGVPAQMLARRPDVRAAELQLRAAFELHKAAQAALYPSLTLGSGTMAGYGANALTDFFKPQNLLLNLIGGLTQPVFAGNRLRAQVRITKAQEEEALVNFERTALTAAREVSDAICTYEKAQEKIRYRAAQTESLRKSVYYTRELLRAGEATYLEVLTAQQNFLAARLASVGDRLESAQAAIDLYRALGGGGDNSIIQ